MKYLFLLSVLTALLFSRQMVRADSSTNETNFHFKMLLAGQIDGYPADDDTTAISRYLTAAGDKSQPVPEDVADWIITSLGRLGSSATPRLIEGELHFLRASSVAPPFQCGAKDSARYRLLAAIENDLEGRRSPISELALLFFKESDDHAISQIAEKAHYDELAKYPYLIGYQPWMDWITTGLAPDPLELMNQTNMEQWPVITDHAKAGLLHKVRAFFGTIAVVPPTTNSYRYFVDFTIRGNIGRLAKVSAPLPSNITEAAQEAGLMRVVYKNIAKILNCEPVPDARINELAELYASTTGNPFEGQASFFCDTFRRNLGIKPNNDPMRGFHKDGFDRLCDVLVAQEELMIAFEAYGTMIATREQHLPKMDLAPGDLTDFFANLRVPREQQVTTIVQSLPQSLVQTATNPPDVTKFGTRTLRLKQRMVSLENRQFVEVLKGVSSNGAPVEFSVCGIVPTVIVRLLEINPGFLDITRVSLALRQLSSGTHDRIQNPEDFDLIELDPSLATGFSLAALSNPELPWTFARDTLIQRFPADVEWFMPGWVPTYPAPLGSMDPWKPSNILPHDKFVMWRDGIFYPETQAYKFNATWRFYHGVFDTVNNMPSYITTYPDPITKLLSFGGGGTRHYTPKKHLLDQLQAMAHEANRYVETTYLLPAKPQKDSIGKHDYDGVSTFIDATSNEFVSRYSSWGWGQCAIQGNLPLQAPLDSWLKTSLAADPMMLTRYQISFVPSSEDWLQRITDTLAAEVALPSISKRAVTYLQSSELNTYLPSIPAPLENLRSSDLNANLITNTFRNPLHVLKAPLLASPTGLNIAADLEKLDELNVSLPHWPTATRPTLRDDFFEKVYGVEQDALQKVYKQVDSEVADVIAKVNSSPPDNFTVGFSVGVGASVIPGISFQYNGVGLNISFPSSSSIAIAPAQIPNLRVTFGAYDFGGIVPPTASQKFDERGSLSGLPNTITYSGGQVNVQNIDWGQLLANNGAAQGWLKTEIGIASPLLTTSQLADIQHALSLPMFPADLAKLITEKAARARGDEAYGSVADQASFVAACTKGNWIGCGIAVKRELDRHPSTPLQIIQLAQLWSSAYDSEYDRLRKQGHLETATPEAEEVFDKLKDVIDPIGIAKDKAQEAVLDKYLPKLAFLVRVTNLTGVQAVAAFFSPSSSIATDFDEVQLMNNEIQDEVSRELAPFMKNDWQGLLNQSLTSAGPEWKSAPLPIK